MQNRLSIPSSIDIVYNSVLCLSYILLCLCVCVLPSLAYSINVFIKSSFGDVEQNVMALLFFETLDGCC